MDYGPHYHLGADEINTSINRLVPSSYPEHLPLQGAFCLC